MTCPKPILLPQNEWLWDIFQTIATQSRIAGMGGFVGFDYNSLPFILEAKDVPRAIWWQVLEALELLSPIASEQWNKKAEE